MLQRSDIRWPPCLPVRGARRSEAWRVNPTPPPLSRCSAAATCLVPPCTHLVPMILLVAQLHVSCLVTPPCNGWLSRVGSCICRSQSVLGFVKSGRRTDWEERQGPCRTQTGGGLWVGGIALQPCWRPGSERGCCPYLPYSGRSLGLDSVPPLLRFNDCRCSGQGDGEKLVSSSLARGP